MPIFTYGGEEDMDRVQTTPPISTINETLSDTYTVTESKDKKESENNVHKQKTYTNVSDSVELSDTARLMSAVQQEISMMDEKETNGFSEEQRKKIEEIKQRIASGEYKIDTQKIARNILLEDSTLIK